MFDDEDPDQYATNTEGLVIGAIVVLVLIAFMASVYG